ncbi:hypothetical protein ZOSMA_153G00040 [Zostera marina]|uniref:D-cysteine desulfhydrase 2, mitochondrial n=1 Tax=Zostera marina TaxID=29655 RepID=A0A0K9PVT0_ZOSMR|nr:hypothetical protein ZOSMA_153G00040 [Zostera marina]
MHLCKTHVHLFPQQIISGHFLHRRRRFLSFSSSEARLNEVLNRSWLLPKPDAEIHKIFVETGGSGGGGGYSYLNDSYQIRSKGDRSRFYVIRDDLLHPLVNGNKARKLDAVLPILQNHSVTDVVTCGGCQSAHTAAVAVSCAERSIRSHLVLRGEQPAVPTGYNLVSLMYATNVVYVSRSVYADRTKMLRDHADLVAASSSSSIFTLDDIIHGCNHEMKNKVAMINEGAVSATALLGVIRLVRSLSQPHLLGRNETIKIVLDAGTGTTATGFGLAVKMLGLPWKIVAVMLGGESLEAYKNREMDLISDFNRSYGMSYGVVCEFDSSGIVEWVERIHPRRFGKVLKGEMEECKKISQQTGIPVDPIYTLAAWEYAVLFSQEHLEHSAGPPPKVVMLHTGGTLGMFGLAQRYMNSFHPKP